MYERKTVDVWVVQGDYGQGWEDLTESYDRNEAKTDAKKYRENDSAPIRVIKRRERKPEKKEPLTLDVFVGECLKKISTGDNVFDAKYAYEEMVVVMAIGKEDYVAGIASVFVCIAARIIYNAWQEDRWGKQGVEEILKCRNVEEKGAIDNYAKRIGKQVVGAIVNAFERGAE